MHRLIRLGLMFVGFGSGAVAADRPPNVVLILADDLGYGDLGCYGSKANRTPHLDRMAAEGTRFTDFYSAAPVCSPTRAALMTGCYPQRVGLGEGPTHAVLMPGDKAGLDPRLPTLPRVLKDRGYATACFGKWHLGDQSAFLPTRHGFDTYFGIPYSNDMKLGVSNPNTKQPHPPLPLLRGDAVVESEPDQTKLTRRLTDAAAQFIRENKDRPFFVYFPHYLVHLPLHPPPAALATAEGAAYRASVENLDSHVGELLDLLRELKLDRDTLVFFTSDNGGLVRAKGPAGASNAPLRGGKGTTFEGGMRVPAIAWRPGTVPAGAVRREPCGVIDLLPTAAALTGAKLLADRKLDGADLGPLLRGDSGAKPPHEAMLYYKGWRLEAVRSGDWKLFPEREAVVPGRPTETRKAAAELYNLSTDVGETTDVAAANPDVVRRLTALAVAARADLGDGPRAGPGRGTPAVVANPATLTPRR